MQKNKGFISILVAGIIALVSIVSVGTYLNSQESSLSVGGNTVTPLPVRNFLGLTDTPNSYSGQGGKVVQVNAGATALEFATASGGIPTQITVADTTDTTSFVGLWTDATGDLGPKTDAGLTYNATTGMLTATGLTGPLTGNASTASALFANGSNCSSGSSPLGVDASGAVESCFDVWTEAENTSAGYTTLAGVAGVGYLTGNQSISLSGDISGSGATAITTTIGADKVLESMLKAVDAAGDEECLTYESTAGDFEWQTCGGAAGASTALDNLASVAINTTLLSDTDNTDALGTTAIAWSDLFLGSGGVITFNSAPSTPDITLTHSADTLTFSGGTIALGTATATGGLTGNVTGALTGNASTATALAADPADCVTSTHFAVGIVASGVATCEAIADADVPNNITIDLATSATLAVSSSDLTCTDCINATEIEDIFTLNSGDTITGALTINDNGGTGSTLLTIGDANDADSVQIFGDLTITGDDLFMATNTSGALLVADGTNFNPVVMGGDATIGTTGTLAIAANAVALGTDTTNAYVSDLTAGTLIDVSGGGAETANVTVTVDTTELEATTFGAGGNASNAWTFNLSGTDPVLTAVSTGFQINDFLQIGHAGTDGSLKIYSEDGATDHSTIFNPGVQTMDVVYTLPVDDGTASQFLQTNGSGVLTWATAGGGASVQTFTSTGAGTWTKPASGTRVLVQVWGAGGSGGRGENGDEGAGGGGGGGYVEKWFDIGDLGATEAISVGTGGIGQTVDATAGNPGGNSTFGASATLVTAYGGAGGGKGGSASRNGGGGGGGAQGAGSAPSAADDSGGAGGLPSGTNLGGQASAINANGFFNAMGGGSGGGGSTSPGAGGSASYGGGGGGAGKSSASNTTGIGGSSIWGGGGGGGASTGTSAAAGGISINGGNGSAGTFSTTASSAGAQPGGGSGGTQFANSGAGGNGKVVVTTF